MKRFMIGLIISMMLGALAGCMATTRHSVVNQSSGNVALAATKKTNSAPVVSKKPSSNEAIKPWLAEDLTIASQAHFPAVGQTYALDWNNEAYANGPKKFNAAAETKRLWIGGFVRAQKHAYFAYYSGPFDAKKFYERVQSGASQIRKLTFVYVLENGSNTGDPGHLTPAMSIDLGNGEFLAFAKNQVITKSVHAGMEQYVVYEVPGIKIPQ